MRGNAAITAFERGVQWHRALQAFLKAGVEGSDWQRDETIFDCSDWEVLGLSNWFRRAGPMQQRGNLNAFLRFRWRLCILDSVQYVLSCPVVAQLVASHYSDNTEHSTYRPLSMAPAPIESHTTLSLTQFGSELSSILTCCTYFSAILMGKDGKGSQREQCLFEQLEGLGLFSMLVMVPLRSSLPWGGPAFGKRP